MGNCTLDKKRMISKLMISNYDSINNPHYSGGGAIAVQEISERLAKRYEITIISGKYKGAKDTRHGGITYLYRGTDLFGPRIGQLLFPIYLMWEMRKSDYDLWLEGSVPPFTFSLLPYVSKKPIISWVQMLAGSEMERKYRLPFTRIEGLLSRRYRYIIVPIEWTKKVIKNRYGNNKARIKPIAYGIDRVKSLKVKVNKRYLLFLGRFEIEQKGLDLLFESLSKTEKITLVIAGGGDEASEAHLRKLVEEYKLNNRVTFAGWVRGAKKEKLLRECAALVLPSRFDTYPLTVLEAFAYAKPVVFFYIPQLSWIPRKASLNAIPFNTTEYAELLAKIATDNRLQNKLGMNGYEFAKVTTWDTMAQKIDNFLETI